VGALGFAFIVVQAAILIAWIAGPVFPPRRARPDAGPTYMKVAMTAFQVILPIAGLSAIYLFVVRPWRA